MQEKIRSAKTALRHPDTILMARTDAISAEGSLAAAIDRGRAYVAAGADALFIEALRTRREIREIPRSFPDVPLLINLMEGGKTPLVPHRTLEDWGYNMIAHPITSILAQTKAIQDALVRLRRHETTRRWSNNHLFDFQKFCQLIGLEKEVKHHAS
jgi:methylisocitrate lyase